VEEGDSFAELYAAVGTRLWRAVFVYTGGQREMADDVVAEEWPKAKVVSDHIRSFSRRSLRTTTSRQGLLTDGC
jgi:DNA-directed RNA polymerase specialized sigma24 family protein